MLLSLSHAPFAMPADAILVEFQTQQHLSPHRPLAEMLETAGDDVGFCRSAARRAVRSLGLDGAAKIGRLNETELVELSQTIRQLERGQRKVTVPASVA